MSTVPPVRKVVYRNEKDSHFHRTYSNTAFVQPSPRNDIVVEFFEEFIEPVMIEQHWLNTDPPLEQYSSDDPSEVRVTRSFKCSVTMSREVAVELAKLIFSMCDDQGGGQE